MNTLESSKMNIKNRIEKLEKVGIEIKERQGNLALAAKAFGLTVEEYKVVMQDIASLPDYELVRLSEMVKEKMDDK